MAARFWALVLAARLLVAAAVAAGAGAILRLSIVAATVAGVTVWSVVSLAAVAASFAAARSGAHSPRIRTGPMWLLRIVCAEALALDMTLVRMAADPLLERVDRLAGPGSHPPARVVLVHGIACNRAVWRPLLAALRFAGIEGVHAVNLEPLFADIDTHARNLLARLEAIGASPARPVAIVAHSMGGLVARAALREAKSGMIGRIITVGTPHHGTAIACRFRWPSTRQMCCGSPWLLELNARQEARPGLPVTSLHSLDDNLIVPAGSAVLPGARSIELRGLGHLSLLCSPDVLRRIVAELRA